MNFKYCVQWLRGENYDPEDEIEEMKIVAERKSAKIQFVTLSYIYFM